MPTIWVVTTKLEVLELTGSFLKFLDLSKDFGLFEVSAARILGSGDHLGFRGGGVPLVGVLQSMFPH